MGPVSRERLRRSRILIVDDEPANVRILERVLERAGYTEIKGISDSRNTVAAFRDWSPDLLLLDLNMPFVDGFDILEELEGWKIETSYVPVLVLTADATRETKQRALSHGAKDFLAKPFDATEVVLRIENLLQARHLHLELQDYNSTLEAKVLERTEELDTARWEIIERLAHAAEYRDDDTHQHTSRVGNLSAFLAKARGMSQVEIELVRRASPLHDVGKIGIPDDILLKPGKLTPEEFEVMKTHVAIGAGILSGSEFSLLQVATEIVLTHHERWDGNGYPNGLTADEIPLIGRIVAVADVFDALTHERPYKRAWPVPDALAEIERQSGRQFDPELVAILVDLCKGGTQGPDWNDTLAYEPAASLQVAPSPGHLPGP
ncbi:response regulator [soil metagenome]